MTGPQPLLLNHAGASPMSAAALAALQQHLALETRLGPMEAGEAVEPQLQRLREDAVTESDRRADYQRPAPATENGLYLVPKVIE